MNARFDGVEARLRGRIDGLQLTMIQVGGGTIVAVLATLASILATQTLPSNRLSPGDWARRSLD